MAIRSRKPTSPGRRFQPSSDFSGITKTSPEKSLLAIGRALAVEAEVLVLDEPTASLPANAVERVFHGATIAPGWRMFNRAVEDAGLALALARGSGKR